MQRRENLEKLIEQIDACRAGSDDVHAPDLEELRPLEERLEHDAEARALYDSLQGFDERIGAAVREVRLEDYPQTAGLEERLLAAVAKAETADDVLEAEEANDPVANEPPSVRRSSRRQVLVWLAGLAATAAGVGMVVRYMNPPEQETPWDRMSLLDAALTFYTTEEPAAPGDKTPGPDDYPFSDDVVKFPGTRWREVNGFLGTEQAIAYHIPAEGGNPVATLYVVRLSVPELPQWPSSDPDHGTGNVLLSAWQTGDLVYVLVVHGNKDAYQRFVKKLHRQFA